MTVQHRRHNNSFTVNGRRHKKNMIIDCMPLSFLENSILPSSGFEAEISVTDHIRYNVRIVTSRINDETGVINVCLEMVIESLDDKTI